MNKINQYIENPYRIFLPLASRGLFKSMDDETYLKLIFHARMGYKLDLTNPKTFNEKLQWLKLYDRKPEYTAMVDKYEAKKYVADRIGGEHIIPTLGVWDSFDDIDFSKLPDQFVLKCTHDSGGLAICKNKDQFDITEARRKIESSLAHNYYLWGREWPYKNVKPRIIAEQYMTNKENNGLIDYKFYCFNGSPEYLYVSQGMDNHETARLSFATVDWKIAPFGRNDYLPLETLPEKPTHFQEMVDVAKQLSHGHPFLRVDLYEINGRVYFSELTFSPCAGFMQFEPEEYDLKLGSMLELPVKKQS